RQVAVAEALAGLHDTDPVALLGGAHRGDAAAEPGADDQDVVVEARHGSYGLANRVPVAPVRTRVGHTGAPGPVPVTQVSGQAERELAARADAELAQHLAHVPLHRAVAEEQLGADLGVRHALAGHGRDLGLLRRQLVEIVDGAPAHGLPRRGEL